MIFISKNLYLYTMLYYGLLNGKIEYGMRPFEGCESIEITEPGNKTVYVIKGETYYGDVFKSIIISDNYLNGLEKLDEIILKHFDLDGHAHPENTYNIEATFGTNTNETFCELITKYN